MVEGVVGAVHSMILPDPGGTHTPTPQIMDVVAEAWITYVESFADNLLKAITSITMEIQTSILHRFLVYLKV